VTGDPLVLAATHAGEDDDWLRPIDLMVDSYAPEEIAFELVRRHALYVREAQRLALEGLVPDEAGLAGGIHAESVGYRRSRPGFAHASLDPAFEDADAAALESLRAIVAAARAAVPHTTPQARPVRRLALQPSPTIVGNMSVSKRRTAEGLELSWDGTAAVTEWTLRVSVRPDPRADYVEGDDLALPGGSLSFVVRLDEHPRRLQLYGRARDGRIVRRATVSALTEGNCGSQWRRQATAS
jgi:hypothetical protein